MAKETSKDIKEMEAAKSNATVVQEQAPKKEQKVFQGSVYSVNELAANAKKVFGTRQECIMAALRAAGKTECTVAETKEIVEKFLKREVR